MAKIASSSAAAKGAAKKGGAGDVKTAKPAVAKAAKAPAKTVGAVAKKVPAKSAPVKAAAKKAPAKTATKAPAKAVTKPAAKAPVAPAAAKKTTTAASKAATVKKTPEAPVKAAPKATPAPAAKPVHANDAATDSGRKASAVASASPSRTEKSAQFSMNSTTLENGITKEDGRYALPATTVIDLPAGYRPNDDDGEEYMSPKHLAYYRAKLKKWREDLIEESRQTMDNLREEVRDVGDEAERATRETENSLELRTRDRYRKLISKIDKALRRIEEGRYGFCEETDEEIGLERLDARPIATLTLDAQERREHLQKQMGD